MVIAHVCHNSGCRLHICNGKRQSLETGTHAELVARNGAYAKLYAMQFADDEGNETPPLHRPNPWVRPKNLTQTGSRSRIKLAGTIYRLVAALGAGKSKTAISLPDWSGKVSRSLRVSGTAECR